VAAHGNRVHLSLLKALLVRIPPSRIVTARFVLRCWDEDAAPMLKDAVDSSLAELQQWMDWALQEPSEIAAIQERLAKRRLDFHEGRDFFYLIFDPAEQLVLGGTGLHTRLGPDALEIGYWIRTDRTRQGLATEVARVLTQTAFEAVGVHRVEIRCDPNNVASAAVPRRLGYRLREVLRGNALTPNGQQRDTMVWEMTAQEFASRELDGRHASA
jgi:RimJ/RimL family protein N-acetyltransferase